LHIVVSSITSWYLLKYSINTNTIVMDLLGNNAVVCCRSNQSFGADLFLWNVRWLPALYGVISYHRIKNSSTHLTVEIHIFEKTVIFK
jgi:hypothetical protein